MSKIRYSRKQGHSLVPAFSPRNVKARRKQAALDAYRERKMADSDYQPLTCDQKARLELIREVASKPRLGKYTPDQIEVLPPAPNQKVYNPVRIRHHSRRGKMS